MTDDVVFVKYVPPPCDEEIEVVPYIDLTRVDIPCCTGAPAIPTTPVWVDMWEDLDDDRSGNYTE